MSGGYDIGASLAASASSGASMGGAPFNFDGGTAGSGAFAQGTRSDQGTTWIVIAAIAAAALVLLIMVTRKR